MHRPLVRQHCNIFFTSSRLFSLLSLSFLVFTATYLTFHVFLTQNAIHFHHFL